MTDIEGSTGMLAELEDGYGPLLEVHHHVVRSAATRVDGVEVTNAGDGLAFIFPTVAQAAIAAVDLQHGLRSTMFRVRAAIHVGGIVTTSAGPVGMVLHHCARLLAA